MIATSTFVPSSCAARRHSTPPAAFIGLTGSVSQPAPALVAVQALPGGREAPARGLSTSKLPLDQPARCDVEHAGLWIAARDVQDGLPRDHRILKLAEHVLEVGGAVGEPLGGLGALPAERHRDRLGAV